MQEPHTGATRTRLEKIVERTVRPHMDTRRIRRSVRVLHNEPGQGEGKVRQVARLA
jgi:hypothetical protein